MAFPVRALRRRRLVSLALAATFGAAIVAQGASVVTAADAVPVSAAVVSAAESAMVNTLNADRTALGLVPLQVDARLMSIAHARSNDMVAKHYFSHTQPDGRNIFDILTGQHISWYTAGEIIAWNNYPMDSTVSAANRQWQGSPGHWAIVTSNDYNYVGVGLAVDPLTGKKVWTADYLKGPDRTAARSTAAKPALGAWTGTHSRYATVSWSGWDPRLQVLTAGLHSFTLQRRLDGGSWVTLMSSTTSRHRTYNVWLGHVYEYRIAARDNAGNRGPWSTIALDLR